MRGERRGAPDDNGNVYALFPGIDTTPFGPENSSDYLDVSDDGWSAVPKRTITYDHATSGAVDRAASVRGRLRRPASHPAPATVGVAVAILVGAGIGVGRDVLSGTTTPTNTARHQPADRSPTGPMHPTTATLSRILTADNRGVTHRRRKAPRDRSRVTRRKTSSVLSG
jgi:hypothetical protein